jgi:hypothetical protein
MATDVEPEKSYIPDVIAAGYGYFIVDGLKHNIAAGIIKDDENLLKEADAFNQEMQEECGFALVGLIKILLY